MLRESNVVNSLTQKVGPIDPISSAGCSPMEFGGRGVDQRSSPLFTSYVLCTLTATGRVFSYFVHVHNLVDVTANASIKRENPKKKGRTLPEQGLNPESHGRRLELFSIRQRGVVSRKISDFDCSGFS